MADANQVTEALTCIKAVRDRLEAWRDDAQMRLERSPVGTEPQLRNLRDSYRHLAETLLQAELALQGPHYKPNADDLPDGEGWVAKRHDGVELTMPPDEPANPDSVVRERA